VPYGFQLPQRSKQRYRLGGITFATSLDWQDTTEPDQPFTLCRPEGVGAFQFSVGFYSAGKLPDFSIAALKELLLENAQQLGPPCELAIGDSPQLAACTFRLDDDCHVRMWYVSDGLNLAKVTYTSTAPLDPMELADAEAMVRTITFESPTAQ
jgi:hypothetical protein